MDFKTFGLELSLLKVLNVVLNSKVVRIRRPQATSTTPTFLRIRLNDDSTYVRKYEFVICTGDMKSVLQAMSWKNEGVNAGPFPEEYNNFLRVNGGWYKTTVLADTTGLTRGGTPVDVFVDNIENKRNGPFKMVDAYALSQQQTNETLYRAGNYTKNNDGSQFRTVQITHYTREPVANIAELQNDYFGEIERNFDVVDVQFSGFKSSYVNPRFTSRDITNSMIWKILAMQGKYGMWYIGPSVIHESLNSQFLYNELLVMMMT